MKYWMTRRVTDRPTGRVGINNQRKASSCRRISGHRISRVRLTASLFRSPSPSCSLDLLVSINPISFAISRFSCGLSGNIFLETVQYETRSIQAINRKSCMLRRVLVTLNDPFKVIPTFHAEHAVKTQRTCRPASDALC